MHWFYFRLAFGLVFWLWGEELGGHFMASVVNFFHRNDAKVDKNGKRTLCGAYQNQHASSLVQSWANLNFKSQWQSSMLLNMLKLITFISSVLLWISCTSCRLTKTPFEWSGGFSHNMTRNSFSCDTFPLGNNFNNYVC